jgi:hypothetical protein
MIIDSNAPSPLKYTDATYQASLFVRANIYDTSGVAPVLEGTVNLAQINNGTYWGKYTFTAGKTYLVQKLVYTSGSYAVVDQNYGQDNDDVQCIDLKIANLDAAISTRASQATVALDATVAKTADARFAHLDVDVSTRLAAVSYTAPDNAGISAIAADVADIPGDVWSEDLTAYNTADTAGKLLKDSGGGGGGTCTLQASNLALEGEIAPIDLAGDVNTAPDLTGTLEVIENISC